MVPLEYALGDVFRDGEEVVVIIRGEDGQLLQARSSWIFSNWKDKMYFETVEFPNWQI